MRCSTSFVGWALGLVVVACAPQPGSGHVGQPMRLAALMTPSLPPWTTPSWEVESLIQAKIAEEHATCCVGVWIKHLVAAPELDSADGYWFKGDYYELDPCAPRPLVFAVKGHCNLHNHQMHIYDMREEPDPCPFPVCSGTPGASLSGS